MSHFSCFQFLLLRSSGNNNAVTTAHSSAKKPTKSKYVNNSLTTGFIEHPAKEVDIDDIFASLLDEEVPFEVPKMLGNNPKFPPMADEKPVPISVVCGKKVGTKKDGEGGEEDAGGEGGDSLKPVAKVTVSVGVNTSAPHSPVMGATTLAPPGLLAG